MRTFCPHLSSFCAVSSFTTFRPNFTSGLLQMILPGPRIGMLILVTVSPVIIVFHSCCLLHHVFDQVNLWPAWVGFETTIFSQCSPGTVETQRLYPQCQKGFFFFSAVDRGVEFLRFQVSIVRKITKMRTKSPQKIKINYQKIKIFINLKLQ